MVGVGGVGGVAGEVRMVAGEVFAQEAPPLGARGEHVVGALETAPLGEVVGEVEGGGRRGGVFVVDEVDGFGGGGDGVAGVVGVDDHVAAEEVAVAEDELGGEV